MSRDSKVIVLKGWDLASSWVSGKFIQDEFDDEGRNIQFDTASLETMRQSCP